MKMDKKIIEELFNKVSSHFEVIPEETKGFFSMFVEETLIYRDELVAQGDKPLTIAEVQQALDLLSNILSTRKMPTFKIPDRTETLLKRWIGRLNEMQPDQHAPTKTIS